MQGNLLSIILYSDDDEDDDSLQIASMLVPEKTEDSRICAVPWKGEGASRFKFVLCSQARNLKYCSLHHKNVPRDSNCVYLTT